MTPDYRHTTAATALTAAPPSTPPARAGKEYVTSQPYNLERSFADARPGTPIFVFLSPGVDVAGSVEALGRKLGFTSEGGNYFSVSLGQGQVRAAPGQGARVAAAALAQQRC